MNVHVRCCVGRMKDCDANKNYLVINKQALAKVRCISSTKASHDI